MKRKSHNSLHPSLAAALAELSGYDQVAIMGSSSFFSIAVN